MTVAWVRVERGRILCARSRGKDVFYIPGGKLETGESDLDALLREIREELSVELVPETVREFGTYQAQAHGQADGVQVVMNCYTADYQGAPSASREIAELDWLGYADRDRVAPVDQLLFDDLLAAGQLAGA
jgi:8-oxo-dGTP diphosphatase